MSEKWIVVIGNLVDGYQLVGPFESETDATNWAMDNDAELNCSWYQLINPWEM